MCVCMSGHALNQPCGVMYESSPGWHPVFLICVPSLPPTHVIAPRVIYGNETSRPDPRHDATRHGTVAWPWTAASTTAAACWPWRVKFKVSNNWSESNRGVQSQWENRDKRLAGIVTQNLRRFDCQTLLPLAFYFYWLFPRNVTTDLW